MAIAITHKASVGGGSSATTGSFTAAANSLLIAVFGAAPNVDDSNPTLDPANVVISGGGLSWAFVAGNTPHSWSDYVGNVGGARWANSGAGGSMTVTISDYTGWGLNECVLSVYEVTGDWDTASPIGATGGATFDGAPPSEPYNLSLSGTTAATSIVLAAVYGHDTDLTSFASGWAGLTRIVQGGSVVEAQYYEGAISQATFDAWDTFDTWFLPFAMEIKETGGGPPDITQTKYRFFEDGDELPHIDEGTTPIIESGDITTSGSNTAATTLPVAHPAYVAGDLLIAIVACDDDDNITPPAAGPNSETRVIIKGPGDVEAGTNGPAIAAMYWIGTGTQSSGTQNWAVALSEQWLGRVIKVPAGEFDPANPIGAISDGGGSNADIAGWDSVSFVTPRANSRVVQVMAADVDPWNATQPTGYTRRNTQDIGAVAIQISTRDAETTAGETVGSATFDLNGTNVDSVVGFGFTVQAPRVADGRTPLASENTGIVRDTEDPFGVQIRFESGSAVAEDTYKLQYRLNAGTWTDVTGSSSVIRTVATADYADGDDALEYLLGSGTFVANNNAAIETDGTFVLAATLGASAAVEVHATLEIQDADVSDADDIELRIVLDDDTEFDTYTVTPTIEVNKAAATSDGAGASSIAVTAAAVGAANAAATGAASLSVTTSAVGAANKAAAGAASLEIAASAAGAANNSATGAASLSVTTSAVGAANAAATGAASLSVTTSAVGAANAAATGAASLEIAASAAGAANNSATGAASASIVASAVGVANNAAAGASAINIAAAAVGVAVIESAGAATIAIDASGVGEGTKAAAGAALIDITASAAGQSTAAAVGTASTSIAATAAGQSIAAGVGAATSAINAAAIGESVIAAAGASSMAVTAAAEGASIAAAAGEATISVAAAATATQIAAAAGDAQIAISASGSSDVASTVAADGAAAVSIAAAATGAAINAAAGDSAAAISASATGAAINAAAGDSAAAISASATGAAIAEAAGSATIAISAAADGAATKQAAGAISIAILASGASDATGVQEAAGSASIGMSAAATGAATKQATGAVIIAFVASGASYVPPETPKGSVTTGASLWGRIRGSARGANSVTTGASLCGRIRGSARGANQVTSNARGSGRIRGGAS